MATCTAGFFVTNSLSLRLRNQILAMKTILYAFGIVLFCLFSFTKPKKPITTLEGMKKELRFGYSYVPSGNMIYEKDTVSVQGFFMFNYEVSNFNYLEFLAAVRPTLSIEEYNALLPDTLAWRNPLTFGEKFVDYYLRHPAYRDYPVVNVSKAQAEKYCEWLTTVLREKTGNQSIIARLPLHAEYMKAAFGNDMQRPYAWNSPSIFSANGEPKCNFLNVGADAITRDSVTGRLKVVDNYYSATVADNLSDYADFTAPAKSYWPNELGLYHLNGNVSELVAEDGIAVGGDWNCPGYDVRNYSKKPFTKPNPMVGFRPVITFVETK